MRGLFSHWQPTYAVRGIPTFPVEIVDGRKKPRVRGYAKVGIPYSTMLVAVDFQDCHSFGFMCGRKSNITVGDVDAAGDELLYAGLEMWGDTPFIVRTASGYHCYYRNGGERRQIRPLGMHKPYDVLGDGFVVPAPSLGPRGQYQIIRGSVDDLEHLPPMRQLVTRAPQTVDKPWDQMVSGDGRNHHLWYFLMGQAHGRSPDEIAEIAIEHNRRLKEPMADAELSKIAHSVCNYEDRGCNFVGVGKAMVLRTGCTTSWRGTLRRSGSSFASSAFIGTGTSSSSRTQWPRQWGGTVAVGSRRL